MIIGVTHDQDGRVVQRLSVSTKVSIGLPPNGDRNHPTKLDHFVFLRNKKSSNRVGWEADPELTEHYGDECRELHIMLIDDDIENVFPTSYYRISQAYLGVPGPHYTCRACPEVLDRKTITQDRTLAQNHHPYGGYCSPATDPLPWCFKHLHAIRIGKSIASPLTQGTGRRAIRLLTTRVR